MSFGFSVGDFLAVIALANKIRKDFSGAPDQFKDIAQDVRTLSIVLQDASVNVNQLPEDKINDFQTILASCHALLQRLEKIVDKWSETLEPNKGKSVRRLWKRLKWEPEEIRDLRSQLTSKVTLLNTFNDQATSHNVAKLVRRNDDKKRQTLLEWISPIDYVAQQNHLVSRRQAGSRKWLFDSVVYAEWQGQKGQILYCPGDPGTGKTFTTAMVIERLQEQTQNDSGILNTYLYCTYQTPDQDVGGLLSSLLRNSLQQAPGLPEAVLSLYDKCESSNKSLLRDEVVRLLQSLYMSFARVNLLVDALDELPIQVRRPFISELLKLQQSQSISLFVTSRNIPEIQRPFDDQSAFCVEIRASDEDVRQFLMDSLFQLPSFVGRSPVLQTEIVQAITDASSGMFLLAELHLRSLMHKKSPTALRSSLSKLAIGSDAYDNAYQDAMTRIAAMGSESENLAKQALLILSCARQPLLPEDLAYALSVEPDHETIDEDNVPDIEDVVAICTGLVIIDKESNVVRLVHKSTQEYFERNRSHWFPGASEIMARLCIQYKSIAVAQMSCNTDTATNWPPFWRYADANWVYHTLAAEHDSETGKDKTTTSPWPAQSPKSSPMSKLSLNLLAKEMGGSLQSTLLAACREGRHALAELLLMVNNYDLNQSSTDLVQRNRGKTSRRKLSASQDNVLLTIAAKRGDHTMVEILLNQGADPNTKSTMGQTALYIAAANGFESLVSLLLDQKSTNPNCECPDDDYLPVAKWKQVLRPERQREKEKEEVLWTPLLVAARKGHLGCVRSLLDRGDRSYRDQFGRNTACLAAAGGHCEVLTELLKWSDIDLASDTEIGNPSALEAAMTHNQRRACLLLIPRSDVNHSFTDGNKPLHHAVKARDIEIVRVLLATEGIEVCAFNSQSSTALMLAVRSRALEILTALGTHPNCKLHRHMCDWPEAQASALDICSNSYDFQQLSTIPMFDINARDSNGDAFLHRISFSNPLTKIEVVKAALEHVSVDVNIRDKNGNTPLMMAAEYANFEALNLLLNRHDVDVNAENSAGNTALLIASSLPRLLQSSGIHKSTNHAERAFELLLHHPSTHKNHKNGAGQNILVLAAMGGTKSILKWITNETQLAGQFHGIFHDGRTVLSYAAESNELDAFEFILGQSPPKFTDLADKGGRTPLSYAAGNVNYKVLRRLTDEPGIRIGLADDQGHTPLDYAIKSSRKESEIWLLMKGAEKASRKRMATEPLPIRSIKEPRIV